MDLSLETKLGVEIVITDINDNPPHFQKDLYEISVEEEKAQGKELCNIIGDRWGGNVSKANKHYSPFFPFQQFLKVFFFAIFQQAPTS